MAEPHRRRLRSQIVLTKLAMVLGLCGVAKVARADARTCIANHEHGQEQQRAGQLVDARSSFTSCAAQSCPTVIRDDCHERLEALVPRIPSLRLSALDRQGEATTDVDVRLDGKLLDAPFEGQPIPVDPGEHRVHFQAPWGEARKIVINAPAGAGSMAVVGDFRADEAASDLPPPPNSSTATAPPPAHPGSDEEAGGGVSAGPWVLGGASLLSFGLFALLAASGTYQENKLLDECAPGCAEEEVDKMRARYAGADVALALGSGLLVGAIIWLAVDLSGGDDEESAQDASAVIAMGAPGGLGLGASVRF